MRTPTKGVQDRLGSLVLKVGAEQLGVPFGAKVVMRAVRRQAECGKYSFHYSLPDGGRACERVASG